MTCPWVPSVVPWRSFSTAYSFSLEEGPGPASPGPTRRLLSRLRKSASHAGSPKGPSYERAISFLALGSVRDTMAVEFHSSTVSFSARRSRDPSVHPEIGTPNTGLLFLPSSPCPWYDTDATCNPETRPSVCRQTNERDGFRFFGPCAMRTHVLKSKASYGVVRSGISARALLAILPTPNNRFGGERMSPVVVTHFKDSDLPRSGSFLF